MAKKKRITYKECHKIFNNTEYKMCKECMTWFEMNEENFKVQPSQKDGFSHKCRKCQEEYNHNNYMKTRDKQIKMARERQLKYHDEYKEYIKAYRKRRYHDENDVLKQREKDSANKRRLEGKYKEWQNTEAGKRSSQKHIKNRQQNKNHIISKKEWIACKEYFKDEDDDYCCAYCGLKIQNHFRIYAGKIQYIDLHKEHVDDNGSRYLDNCVPSCQSCNTSKLKSDFNKWYNKNNPNYTKERYDKITKWTTEDYKKHFEGVREKNKYNRKKKLA